MPTSQDFAELQGEAPASSAPVDSGLFDSLTRPRGAAEFCRTWLSIQCGMISGTVAGLLLLDDGEGHFSSAATWPDNRRDVSYLAETAQQALKRRTSFVHQADASASKAVKTIYVVYVGLPIEWAGRLKGVVVVDLRRPNNEIPSVICQVRWGVGWLEALLGRQQAALDSAKWDRTHFALAILTEAQEQLSFQASALSLANELATRLECCRVSVGLAHGKNMRIAAVSHSAVFNEKTHIAWAIENAMEEAADQNATVALPTTVRFETNI
jgi:hypothetical protein